jgi:hypothetical protein
VPFLFDLTHCKARAEILRKIPFAIWEISRHQNFLLRLTDLLIIFFVGEWLLLLLEVIFETGFWHNMTGFGYLGAKYLVVVSSHFVKMRELRFAEFVNFLRKVGLFFLFLNDKIHNYILFDIIVN